MSVDEEPWFKEWLAWRSRPKTSAAEVTSSVQDLYEAMIRNLISPELRIMGFIGSGGRYWLPAEDRWAMLGFQKSRNSDALELEFTVNLAVVLKSDWADLRQVEPFHPEKPSPQLGTSKVGSQARIGHLYPDDLGDRWWPMNRESDPTEVAYEVLDDIREYGLSWMRNQMDRTDS